MMKSVKEALNQINVQVIAPGGCTKYLQAPDNKQTVQGWQVVYKNTAILRKVVEKSAHANPERYCGWF